MNLQVDYRIRGRHRGLPVAIDRAVLLPTELAVDSVGLRSSDPTTSNMERPAQGEYDPETKEA